ncbi:MAG TPA: hypothetical protein DD490_02930 [Acidobacteria bacterium]|nr:hypothetical protein [Acidobacteriota bacterium]
MNAWFRALCALGAAALLALAPAPGEPPPGSAVEVTQGVRIPLRDGVELNADLYRPAGASGPLPVIWTLTPYRVETYREQATFFAGRGFAFVAADVRGLGGSGGVFEPHVADGRDGFDAVEWIARQPWSNGRIGMWGGSYTGVAQWMLLKERPPHLVTIAPTAAGYPGFDFPMSRNIVLPFGFQWLQQVARPAAAAPRDPASWTETFRKLYLAGRSLRDLEAVAGAPSPIFQKWLSHPAIDAYWKSMVPSAEDYARADLPILTITGTYDGNQPGALRHYREHMTHGSAQGRARHYLVIGPWDHAGTRKPQLQLGGLTFGPASALDMLALHAAWFDATLRGGPWPAFLQKRVAWYVTGAGAEVWKYADDLKEAATGRRTLYLGSGGRLAAAPPPQRSRPGHWVYDPRDLEPGREEGGPIPGLTDDRLVRTLGNRGLVYQTEPFPEPVEITGDVRLTLHLRLDVPDTDLQATLYEILPDGSSVLLGSDWLRARYRHSPERAELVRPGSIERYELNVFPWFSRRAAAGSRLRLVVCSPNTLHLQKNYNGGGVVAEESAKDARVAHITVYHDAAHPSALEIPVVR